MQYLLQALKRQKHATVCTHAACSREIDMKRVTRKTALTGLLTIPIATEIALTVTARPAEAQDNKAQYSYQDKPGSDGAKCSQCSLFKAPNACSLVTGTISPDGWCTAFTKS
jgi:hypothetical protein